MPRKTRRQYRKKNKRGGAANISTKLTEGMSKVTNKLETSMGNMRKSASSTRKNLLPELSGWKNWSLWGKKKAPASASSAPSSSAPASSASASSAPPTSAPPGPAPPVSAPPRPPASAPPALGGKRKSRRFRKKKGKVTLQGGRRRRSRKSKSRRRRR